MKTRRAGFTLIEVMVVLSILALVAILAYSFFGATLRDARLSRNVTKVYKDMENISEALERYVGATGVCDFANETADRLVTAGYLKSKPELSDYDFIAPLGGYTDYKILCNWVGIELGETAAPDDIIYFANFSEEMCKAWNARFTPYGNNRYLRDLEPAWPTTWPTFCYSYSPWGTNQNSLVFVHDRH